MKQNSDSFDIKERASAKHDAAAAATMSHPSDSPKYLDL